MPVDLRSPVLKCHLHGGRHVPEFNALKGLPPHGPLVLPPLGDGTKRTKLHPNPCSSPTSMYQENRERHQREGNIPGKPNPAECVVLWSVT